MHLLTRDYIILIDILFVTQKLVQTCYELDERKVDKDFIHNAMNAVSRPTQLNMNTSKHKQRTGRLMVQCLAKSRIYCVA